MIVSENICGHTADVEGHADLEAAMKHFASSKSKDSVNRRVGFCLGKTRALERISMHDSSNQRRKNMLLLRYFFFLAVATNSFSPLLRLC